MKITLSELNTKNLDTLANRVIAISAKPEYAFISTHPLLLKLKNAEQEYNVVFGKTTFSGLGSEVAEADNTRDKAFSAFKTVLAGYAKMSGLSGSQEATELYAIVKKYGTGLDRYSYSEETAQLNKLIEEMEQPANRGKIDKLYLTELFTQLKTSEVVFEQIFSNQVAANAGLRNMESATSLRSYLENALKNYLRIVTAMEEEELWRSLYAELNEAVKAARNSVQSPAKADTTTGTTK